MAPRSMRWTAMAVLALAVGGPANAQDTLKVGTPVTYDDGSLRLSKDVSVRIGGLLQPSLELQQDLPTAAQDSSSGYNRRWQHQMFVRRMRLLFSGKVTPAFTFFFDFEVATVGRITAGVKNMTPTVNLLDAQMAYIACQQFSVMSGLMLIGPTRNGIQGAISLMPVNYGAFTFGANNGSPNGLDNFVGRDVAVMVRGLFNENRLEYRLSFSDGRSRANPPSPAPLEVLYSPIRTTLRLQYDFWEKQTPDLFSGIGSYFYTGTYFGKKDVLALGGGVDLQGNYSSYAADLFLDHPMGEGDGLTVSLGYQMLDGGFPDGSEITAGVARADAISRLVPKQNVLFAEAGYFIKSANLQPVAKFESRMVKSTNPYAYGLSPVATITDAQYTYLQDLKSETRFGLGLNYVPRGHNFNFKGIWEMVSDTQAGLASAASASNPYPEFKKSYMLFTLQGQWMFF
jgi:hypothetical protein